MSTWDFFPNMMLGKKSHVDMRFSHLNMGFFSEHEIFFPTSCSEKKSHVDFDVQKFHVKMQFFSIHEIFF
jgi:hypothetical protein